MEGDKPAQIWETQVVLSTVRGEKERESLIPNCPENCIWHQAKNERQIITEIVA